MNIIHTHTYTHTQTQTHTNTYTHTHTHTHGRQDVSHAVRVEATTTLDMMAGILHPRAPPLIAPTLIASPLAALQRSALEQVCRGRE